MINVTKKLLFFMLFPLFFTGCNGLIFPVSYEVNIRAFDKEGKVVCCNLETIKKVSKIISKIATKFDYSCPQESLDPKEYPSKAFSTTCFYVDGNPDKALFFWDKEFRIEIRGGTREHKLGEEILETLKNEFPEYIFKFEAKWVRGSILS